MVVERRIGTADFEFLTLEGRVSEVTSSSQRLYSQGYDPGRSGKYLDFHDESTTRVWITTPDGRDVDLKFGSIMPLRQGHYMKAVYIALKNSKSMTPIAVYNQDAKIIVRRSTEETVKLYGNLTGTGLGGCLAVTLGIVATVLGFCTAGTGKVSVGAAWTTFAGGLLWLGACAVWSKVSGIQQLQAAHAALDEEIRRGLGFGDQVPGGVSVREM